MQFKPVSSQIDFPALERELLDYWYKEGIVEKYLNSNKSSDEKFSFLDGPITANNPMGVHHAWGRTYKDLWQRFFNMKGQAERFQNGFDEQGLWVEVEVEKELNLHTKKDIENLVSGDKFKSLEKFIGLCKERVKKFSDIQTEQSKRLGYFMDWGNSYHTSSDENNYAIWNFLKVVKEKGWLYKGHDSVPWCPRCGTAISQHEILTEDYKEISHESVYFKLPIKNKDNEYLLVWTTTPWTIPANVAVAVDPKEKYINYQIKNEKIWIMEKAMKRLQEIGVLLAQPPAGVKTEDKKGEELVGWEYDAAFDHLPRISQALGNYQHRIVATDDLILPISSEEGTGMVHVATGAGAEDFKLGAKIGLPVIELIDEEANYLDGMEDFSGKNAKKHPELIIDLLKNKDNGRFLLITQKILHRYPICWRCKTELVWRVVDEWYIAMDRDDNSKKTYREQMVEVTKRIKWIPNWGLERELDWLKNMHDWLISKKRYWGLALPIWECQKCKNFEVIGSKEELEKRAAEGWEEFKNNSPHRPWVDLVKINCAECGEITSRIPDVGNPWLDAGIVPFSTLPEEWRPADFVTESFPGQFKNWFYSLIAMSTALIRDIPFKNILGFASLLDEKGEPMHKSKGNSIEFNEAADKIGADVMRWLYLRTNPEHNLNFGYSIADEIRRFFHLRLWNVHVFFVTYANLDGWKSSKEKFVPTQVLDKWILSRMTGNIKNIKEGLENYNAHDAAGNAEIFIDDLSTWYVRRIRDRVGPGVENTKDKNDVYETLWKVLTEYSKVLAPFIPFISEAIYRNLTNEESVHLTDWPKFDPAIYKPELEKEMELARKVVEAGHANRKELGIKTRTPLAKLEISLPGDYQGVSEEVWQIVIDELNIKNIVINGNIKFPKNEVKVTAEELRQEGEARDLIREIQQLRKEQNLTLENKTRIVAPVWPQAFENRILSSTASISITKGDELKVLKVENETVKPN